MKNNTPKFLTHLLPTFGNVIWVVTFWSVLLLGRKMMNGDGDLGRHLTLGIFILDQLTIPKVDLFSHTMTSQIMTPHEWLSQVLFAGSYRGLGFNGVVLLCALLIATSMWLVYKRTQLSSKNLVITLAVIFLTILTSALHWLTRPHIFTFLFLALWLLTLELIRKGKVKLWWLLPIQMLFWANIHGAFIAGFVTWFIYGVGVGWDNLVQKQSTEKPLPKFFWRNYLLGGGTSFLISFLNPSGIGLWKTSVGYLGEDFLVNITSEYQAPDFHLSSTWPFLFFIVLLLIVLAYNKKRINSAHLFTSVAWAAMGLYSARNIPLFAIVAAPLLAGGLDNLLSNQLTESKLVQRFNEVDSRLKTTDAQLKGWFLPILCIIVSVAGFVTGIRFDLSQEGYGFDPEKFPVAAVDWLEDNPQEGNVFNLFQWGGYLLYREWPDMLVFIDGQTDFYGEALSRQYMQVIQSEKEWDSVLVEHDISWAILPSNKIVVRMIQLELGWEVLYADETAVILRR